MIFDKSFMIFMEMVTNTFSSCVFFIAYMSDRRREVGACKLPLYEKLFKLRTPSNYNNNTWTKQKIKTRRLNDIHTYKHRIWEIEKYRAHTYSVLLAIYRLLLLCAVVVVVAVVVVSLHNSNHVMYTLRGYFQFQLPRTTQTIYYTIKLKVIGYSLQTK